LGTFDKLQNEEMILGEEAILMDVINDQDIEDLLNGVFDPFDDGEKDQILELDNKMALEGIKMLRSEVE
jgi:hypothetical protein